jgi:hypothetical protein
MTSKEKIIEDFKKVLAEDLIARITYEEAVFRGRDPSDVFRLTIIALSKSRNKLFKELCAERKKNASEE